MNLVCIAPDGSSSQYRLAAIKKAHRSGPIPKLIFRCGLIGLFALHLVENISGGCIARFRLMLDI